MCDLKIEFESLVLNFSTASIQKIDELKSLKSWTQHFECAFHLKPNVESHSVHDVIRFKQLLLHHATTVYHSTQSLQNILMWSVSLKQYTVSKYFQRMSERVWEAIFLIVVFTFFVDLSKDSLILIFELKLVFPISCNLVDPASSHMLVSKIKPCMSQYKFIHGETAKGSLKQ